MNEPSEAKDLHLALDSKGSVEFSRSPQLSDNDWSRVQTAFGASAGRRKVADAFLVDPLLFEARISWFRVWIGEGKTVGFSKNLLALVAKIRAESQTFAELVDKDPERFAGREVEIPGLLKELTPEQHENIHCLLDMPNGSNFSVPGAGKTLTTLALSVFLRQHEGYTKLLVVCPRSAMSAWREEIKESLAQPLRIEDFSGDPIDQRAEVILVNYEQLENTAKLARLVSWASAHKTHLVIDEAHRIKAGGRSVRWRACKSLSVVVARIDLLTGTPMPNGPEDLNSLFSVAWPKLTQQVLSGQAIKKLRRKTVFVRTTKNELRLPEVDMKVIVQEPSELQAQIMDALVDTYAGNFRVSVAESQALARRGKAVMTLLAAATNPGLLLRRNFEQIEFGFSWPPRDIEEDASLSALISDYLNFETPWKYQKVIEIIANSCDLGQKVIVWSSFVGNLAALKRLLTKFSPAVVFGGTPSVERDSEIIRFKSDPACSVLLTNPQTLGEGISLHRECHTAIYLDRTFNAGQYLQSLDRIHRLGLSPNTRTKIFFLQTGGSLDIRVAARLDRKVEALAKFLEDASLVETAIPTVDETSDEDALGLTREDFDEIMSYLSRS